MVQTLAGLFSRDPTRDGSRASSSPRESWGWAAALVALFVAGISHADGPVVAWGSNGSLWPPASVDGTAIAIAAGYEHTLAIQVPEPTIALLCTFALLMLALLRRRVA